MSTAVPAYFLCQLPEGDVMKYNTAKFHFRTEKTADYIRWYRKSVLRFYTHNTPSSYRQSYFFKNTPASPLYGSFLFPLLTSYIFSVSVRRNNFLIKYSSSSYNCSNYLSCKLCSQIGRDFAFCIYDILIYDAFLFSFTASSNSCIQIGR